MGGGCGTTVRKEGSIAEKGCVLREMWVCSAQIVKDGWCLLEIIKEEEVEKFCVEEETGAVATSSNQGGGGLCPALGVKFFPPPRLGFVKQHRHKCSCGAMVQSISHSSINSSQCAASEAAGIVAVEEMQIGCGFGAFISR